MSQEPEIKVHWNFDSSSNKNKAWPRTIAGASNSRTAVSSPTAQTPTCSPKASLDHEILHSSRSRKTLSSETQHNVSVVSSSASRTPTCNSNTSLDHGLFLWIVKHLSGSRSPLEASSYYTLVGNRWDLEAFSTWLWVKGSGSECPRGVWLLKRFEYKKKQNFCSIAIIFSSLFPHHLLQVLSS